MATKGKFIVIEGIEGAGKTTALHVLKEWLPSQGVSNVVVTREPGGTFFAERIRSLIKTATIEDKLTNKAELLLMYAARTQAIETVVQPALAHGHWVISDRHNLSSIAYQGGGRGLDLSLITQLKQLVLADFVPDLTIYMDIDPKQGFNRIVHRKLDRIEQQKLDFFKQVRSTYQSIAKHDTSIITIDAGRRFEQVQQQIIDKMTQMISPWLM